MRNLVAFGVIVVALCAFGCNGEASNDGVPSVKGKVEVKDMPEGTVAPGDKRTSPADTGSKTSEDTRG